MADNEAQRTRAAEVGERNPKKPYFPPVVIEYGSLKELTRQESFNPTDGIVGTSPAA